MFYDIDMMHIEETSEAEKKDALYAEDIAEIIAWQGSEGEALKRLNITKEQYKYVRENYTADGRLNYRRNLEVISYE